jgi:flagellar hook assembly protein FlgD
MKSITNKLYQNYPNPFNNQTTIKYDLAEDTFVLINVFNSIGELVKVIDVGDQTPGQYVILWDGTNDENESVSNGIYFYQLRTKNYNKTKKMTLVK